MLVGMAAWSRVPWASVMVGWVSTSLGCVQPPEVRETVTLGSGGSGTSSPTSAEVTGSDDADGSGSSGGVVDDTGPDPSTTSDTDEPPPTSDNRFGIGLVAPGSASQLDLTAELTGPGGTLSWALDEDAPPAAAALQVEGPDDVILPVRVDAASFPSHAMATVRRTGIYRLQERRPEGVRELGLAAVNVPPAEGLLAPIPADSLALRLGLPGLQVIGDAAPLEASLHAGRYGKELARTLLILAALIMALELWLSQRAEQR